ncbi:peptidase U61 [Bacteroidia bacterium]|nr:peptidase U61 [Bacteroidia bacterium]
MFRPNFLQKADKVALVSPAGRVTPDQVEYAIEVLKSWDLEPVEGQYLFHHQGCFAGSDAQRLSDFQWAMDDQEIKAIFCSRGGYGSMRIVEELDYSTFQGNPKWVVGFSDITVFHAKMTSLGIESLHAPVLKNYPTLAPQALAQLKDFLFGKISSYTVLPHPLNRAGTARGELIGGNLSLLHCVRSTVVEHHSHKAILFLEDVGENLYAIDRMMQSFKLSGRLADLQGLVIGDFTDMKGADFGKTASDIIREAVNEYDYPVCFGFPAGHTTENYPLLMGADVELSVDENEGLLKII